MKELVILVPKIYPPENKDIVSNELKNIFSKLKLDFKIKIYWIVFQPYEFEQYSIDDSVVIDYHKFNNAIEIIDKFKPDIIITEVVLGFNGIAFATAGKFRKIPVVTISNPGNNEKMSKKFQFKMFVRLFFSQKILGDVSDSNKKFGFFIWALHRYSFLISTLKKCNKSAVELIKFFWIYPRIQIFSNTYFKMHPILSGDLNICFNKQHYDILLNSNFEKKTLVITGDPAYDHIYDQIQKISKFSQNPDKIHVLLSLSSMHEHGWLSKEEDDKIVLDIIDVILQNPKFEIALKIHPFSSSYDEYDLLLKQTSHNVKIYQKENTIELMNDFDVMINYGSSNVIMDVILSKKPVVMYILNSNEEFNRFYDPNVIIGCTEILELPNAVKKSMKKTISNNSFTSYIENHIGRYDGKSADRAAMEIKKLFKNITDTKS